MADLLRLACADIEAPPLFYASGGGQDRRGFEPDVGRAVAHALGRPLEWRFVPWSEMLPSVRSGDADGVLCGQGITAPRLELVDFTRPYAVFNESVLCGPAVVSSRPRDCAGDASARSPAART